MSQSIADIIPLGSIDRLKFRQRCGMSPIMRDHSRMRILSSRALLSLCGIFSVKPKRRGRTFRGIFRFVGGVRLQRERGARGFFSCVKRDSLVCPMPRKDPLRSRMSRTSSPIDRMYRAGLLLIRFSCQNK